MSCWSPTRAIRISPTVLSFWKSNWRSASCQGPARTARTITRIKIVEAKQIAEWLDALDQPDPDVRWAVILLLARLTEAQSAVMQLTTSLFATGTATQRRMVIYYLKELKRQNEAVRQALLAALHDPDATVRVAAVISLKEQDVDSAGKTTLLDLLMRDPDVRVQHAAAITLASLGSPSEDFLSALDHAMKTAQGPLKKAVLAAQRILQEKKEVRPIRRLTSPLRRTSS